VGRPQLADIVAKVCKLGGSNFPGAVAVPLEKTCGGHSKCRSRNQRFPSRVTKALNGAFSSRRLSRRFSSPSIFRLLQQNRPISAAKAAGRRVRFLGLTRRAGHAPLPATCLASPRPPALYAARGATYGARWQAEPDKVTVAMYRRTKGAPDHAATVRTRNLVTGPAIAGHLRAMQRKTAAYSLVEGAHDGNGV
jgi:hypothetical protein